MESTAERPNGLATYFQVIYAPRSAFASLARFPTWGWALAIAMIYAVASAILLWPTTVHLVVLNEQRTLAHMSAEQAAQARQFDAMFPPSVFAVFSLVGAVIGPWLS